MSLKKTVTEIFTFEAAHYITGDRPKYADWHGHSHVVNVTVQGDLQMPFGWIIEQSQFREIVNSEIEKIDHTLLNQKMENTTAEGIAMYLWQKLRTEFPKGVSLESVEVCKTTTKAKIQK